MLFGISPSLINNIPIHFAQQITVQSEPSLVQFSGSRFFFTVLAGLVLAFAFQMLLTNFSVALGVSILGSGESHEGSSALGGRTIPIAMGLWTIISVSLALFGACALALRFSLVATPLQAIALGLIIWATYFTALVWVSSTTIGSLIGSVVSTATSSFQAIFGTAAAALGAKATKSEIVSTAEEAVAAMRRQVTADIDADDLKDSLQDYLQSLRSPTLDLADLRQEFESLLQDPTLSTLETEQLHQINRESLEALIRDRTDISKEDRQYLVDRMERAWHQAVGQYQKRDRMAELGEFIKKATPQTLLSEELTQQLEQLVQERRKQVQSQDDTSFFDQGLNTLIGIIAGRIDLSDFEVGQVTQQLKQVKEQVVEQADQAYLMLQSDTQPPNIVATDVENYLLNTESWRFTRDRIAVDFREALLDPEANLITMRQQIRGLRALNFKAILKSRGIFTQTKIESIDAQLRQICQEVIAELTSILEKQQRERLSKKVFTYLRLTPQNLMTTEQIHKAFGQLIADKNADANQLRDRFANLNRTQLMKPLQTRNDLAPGEINRILDDLAWVMERTIADAESLQASVEVRVQRQWEGLQEYLRSTGKPELSPTGIQRDLSTLLNDPEAGVNDLQTRLARFDRDTLVQILSQRDDLSEAEINRTLNQVEENWSTVKHAPEMLKAKAEASYHHAVGAIANYLRSTDKAELNPEGIRQDLELLLDDPQAGYEAIYDRLSRMDRDTLVQLLSQRDDLSEAEINQIINQVQSTLQSVLKAPQRLAKRTRMQMQSFQTSLEDYLRSTDKSELNPESIKRDVQALLQDPRWGMQRISDRISQMDESTLIALLAQRDDMTEADAQAIVKQITDVRDQVQAQMAAVTERVQSALDAILNRIRDYLNGLERPELNYDDIRRDVRTLFDDPDAGFEVLRDRLSDFDQNTLIAVLSSHDAISQQDATRIIEQIESTRADILRRAERAQIRLQERLERVKQEAVHQMEATRKTAAIAAWWLFATALISGAAASFGATLAL